MLSLESVPPLDGSVEVVGGLTSLSFPSVDSAPTPNRRARRAPRQPVLSRLGSKEERLKRLAAFQEAQLIERINRVHLPPRFSSTLLLSKFREINDIPWNRDLRDKIDELTLAVEDSWVSFEESRARRELLQAGLAGLRREVRLTERRLQSLSEQRVRQHHWALQCLILGDLGPALVTELSRSWYWEYAQFAVTESLVLEPTIDRAGRAQSRHELDSVVRAMRRETRELASLADRVMADRECLLMALNVWNSPSIDDFGGSRPWSSESLVGSNVNELSDCLMSSTELLREGLLERFGDETIQKIVEIQDKQVPFARALFGALVEEAST